MQIHGMATSIAGIAWRQACRGRGNMVTQIYPEHAFSGNEIKMTCGITSAIAGKMTLSLTT